MNAIWTEVIASGRNTEQRAEMNRLCDLPHAKDLRHPHTPVHGAPLKA